MEVRAEALNIKKGRKTSPTEKHKTTQTNTENQKKSELPPCGERLLPPGGNSFRRRNKKM